jgi:hypothetical protein
VNRRNDTLDVHDCSAFLCSSSAAPSPPVTFESPCSCHDNHGEHRWAVKNDPSIPPTDASAIQAVTPSDVFSWPGPGERLTQSSERTGIENNWFALTGRVVAVKVEMDGDLHLALQDADGKNAGTVSAEIPLGPKWCEIRQIVFGWTKQRFPFTVKTVHDLTIAEHVVTVTGKAFYDIAHAPADHSNRRHSPKDYAVWEIHPVMKLEVVQ